MRAAVVGKIPGRLKFERELVAHSMQAGVPAPVGMTGSARGGAMITGIPHPFDRVSCLDGDCAGRKRIAARADMYGICLRERDLS